jgi:hypothetical protein
VCVSEGRIQVGAGWSESRPYNVLADIAHERSLQNKSRRQPRSERVEQSSSDFCENRSGELRLRIKMSTAVTDSCGQATDNEGNDELPFGFKAPSSWISMTNIVISSSCRSWVPSRDHTSTSFSKRSANCSVPKSFFS